MASRADDVAVGIALAALQAAGSITPATAARLPGEVRREHSRFLTMRPELDVAMLEADHDLDASWSRRWIGEQA